ncbi:hypothetical protein PAPYR_6983 [Paratrimastix pyriformis]|uniref:cAMP-regulated phosphoprotein 19-related protein n=1 Tax=Paratrimastix pyriformis TaxID=342808 RepID=A0ABQ8UGG2_9EUKA|nr:hypothetical protein PAPYR_6983 [Paratrimastix pyriformis]
MSTHPTHHPSGLRECPPVEADIADADAVGSEEEEEWEEEEEVGESVEVQPMHRDSLHTQMQQQGRAALQKYGGIPVKKPPQQSESTRQYFDSADWAVRKAKGLGNDGIGRLHPIPLSTPGHCSPPRVSPRESGPDGTSSAATETHEAPAS